MRDALVDPTGTHIVTTLRSECAYLAGIQELPTPYLGVNGYTVWARVFEKQQMVA
ncbi:MAG: hypothetical protein R2792_09355 [Saprospiraceae bacterium]